MSKTVVTHSYNMDVLSFINVMTSDLFYVKYYQKEYDLFYPLLSSLVKDGMTSLVSNTGVSNVAAIFPIL